MRYHNIIAERLSKNKQYDTDEKIYQQARRLNIASYQGIVYEQLLPYILGHENFNELIGKDYQYDKRTDSTMDLVFTTALYRFGHTAIPERIMKAASNGTVLGVMPLETLFFNKDIVNSEFDASEILNGIRLDFHAEIDEQVVDPLRNKLFGNFEPASDLIARNIQRARDHGLPHVNIIRKYLGLKPYTSFEEIVGEDRPELLKKLKTLYDNDLSKLDLFPMMLCEKKFRDSHLGETATVGIAKQFKALKNGDRFFASQYPYYRRAPRRLEKILSIVYGDLMMKKSMSALITRQTFPSQIHGGKISISWLDLVHWPQKSHYVIARLQNQDDHADCTTARIPMKKMCMEFDNMNKNATYDVTVWSSKRRLKLGNCMGDDIVRLRNVKLVDKYSVATKPY